MMPAYSNNPNRREIQWVSSAHEYIALWLIANPTRHQTELAEEIGYTPSWISAIIHSDLFQAQYRELAEQFGAAVVGDTAAALRAGANEALEAIRERIRKGQASEKFLLESAKTMLTAIGYGAPKVPEAQPQRHLHVHVGAEALRAARERAMLNRFGGQELGPPVAELAREIEMAEAAIEGAL